MGANLSSQRIQNDRELFFARELQEPDFPRRPPIGLPLRGLERATKRDRADSDRCFEGRVSDKVRLCQPDICFRIAMAISSTSHRRQAVSKDPASLTRLIAKAILRFYETEGRGQNQRQALRRRGRAASSSFSFSP